MFDILKFICTDGKIYIEVCGRRSFRVFYYEDKWCSIRDNDVECLFTGENMRVVGILERDFCQWQSVKERLDTNKYPTIDRHFDVAYLGQHITIRSGDFAISLDAWGTDHYMSARQFESFLLHQENNAKQIIGVIRILPTPIADEIAPHICYSFFM